MKAAIVTIGDEILIGQIVDTNSSFIAKKLDALGITITEMRSVSDNHEHILSFLDEFTDKVDLIVITGGLGPTKDDITKKVLCDFTHDTLVYYPNVWEHICNLFEKVLKTTPNELNNAQAWLPKNAEILHNAYGTAPGMWFIKNTTSIISLPGVPFEMKSLLTDQVLPRIIQRLERPVIIHKTILTYGLGESVIAKRIEKWEDSLPSQIKLAYLPSPGRVRLRLTARGFDFVTLKQLLEHTIDDVLPLLADVFVGYEEEASLAERIVETLKNKGLTISFAESCSGGALAQVFTQIAGVSSVFMGSAVCYATESKTQLLGVDAAVIDAFGVVSKEVAEHMALGAQRIYQSDISIATTGNAGPTSVDQNVAVGTVCIALVFKNTVISDVFHFGQPRQKVVDRTVSKALEMLFKEILKN